MAHWIWIILVLALPPCSRKGAKGNSDSTKPHGTPIQVRTASPYEPVRYNNIIFLKKVYKPVTIVVQEVVMFRESPHNTPYPAIVILNKRDYNQSFNLDASVFELRNIAEKTWQPFPQEINLEQLLGRACSGLRWPPTATVSPSKQHIVLYGFGTGRCADKLVIYGDRRSRVITTTGGHAAMGAALATIAVRKPDNSTFDLFAFGGAECLDGSNSSCRMFTDSLRRLRIESGEACLNCSWQKWEIVDTSKSARAPTQIAHAQMFADGASLLLFGGFIQTPRELHFLPDFWRYSFVAEQWVQLESNLNLTSNQVPYGSYYKTLQAAFISEEGTLVLAHDSALHICFISWLRVNCTLHDQSLMSRYYPTAAQSSFYLISARTSVSSFFNIEVTTSCACEAKMIRTKTSPLIQRRYQDSVAGDSEIRAIFIPHADSQHHQYLFFAQAYDATRELWFANDGEPTMSIWSLQYANKYETRWSMNDYIYFNTFNSPAPSHCASVTYLNPYTALLYERPARIWCLSIPTYSWTLGSTKCSHVPPHRNLHVAYKHGLTGMAVYGGLDENDATLGDLWLFHLQTESNCSGSWHNLTSHVLEGNLPKRSHHSVTEYGEDVIIFGGVESTVTFGDLRSNTMFILQIKSKTHVIVRNIEIVPQIRSRISHTLTWYTKTDLLLLGGVHNDGESISESSEYALLVTLGEHNHTIVAKWTVFFKYSISEHTVLNDRVFAREYSARAKVSQFHVIENTNQCPKGYQRERNNSCLPCPVGYYSATIEQQCEKCGNLTTTKSEGSIACELRNPCTQQYCHGHGRCFVNKADYKPFCTCRFGYLPSDQCKVPSVYLALMAAVVFATTATILVIALYQFVRKRRALNATEIQLGNTNRDLQRHRKKLRRINRGTLIRWSDLTIREQLASGTYSKVLLAELGDMTVAVKQFPSYFTIGSLSSPYDGFIQEAEILRGLRHPNIVMFLGAGRDTTSGCPFLVMEYLKRGSLHDILHDPSNSIEHCDRLRFALDAARGLKYLHSSSPPQIHRDIKSPNLLVSDKWVVKVGDLETARFYQSNMDDGNTDDGEVAQLPIGRTRRQSVSYNRASRQVTVPLLANDPLSASTAGDGSLTSSRVGMTCGAGTDRWRSPESIQKNIYTEKHDVYSFGVVLWEIFTRQTPYSDFTRSEDILDEIVNERKPIFPASAPYAYRHLAEQCMNTDAVDRPTIQRVVRELTDQIENI